MKAKEIKKMMLARYEDEIIFYEKALNDVKEREENKTATERNKNVLWYR